VGPLARALRWHGFLDLAVHTCKTWADSSVAKKSDCGRTSHQISLTLSDAIKGFTRLDFTKFRKALHDSTRLFIRIAPVMPCVSRGKRAARRKHRRAETKEEERKKNKRLQKPVVAIQKGETEKGKRREMVEKAGGRCGRGKVPARHVFIHADVVCVSGR